MNYGEKKKSISTHIQYGSTALGFEEDTLSIKPCHYKTHGFSNDPWDKKIKTQLLQKSKGKMR